MVLKFKIYKREAFGGKMTKAHIDVGKTILASPLTIWDLITYTSQWTLWGLLSKRFATLNAISVKIHRAKF
jgi:hypothetical protein